MGRATFVDLLGNPKIGFPNITEQGSQVLADFRIVVEQQLLEHGLMERNHFSQMRS